MCVSHCDGVHINAGGVGREDFTLSSQHYHNVFSFLLTPLGGAAVRVSGEGDWGKQTFDHLHLDRWNVTLSDSQHPGLNDFITTKAWPHITTER